MAVIEVENVSKVYRGRRGTPTLLVRGGVARVMRRERAQPVTALENITFTVGQGESLGIIGANGSGKSTLLKIIAGVTLPTAGHVRVYGRVASLLELGAGFHPLLTGRENIYLNARLLGMTREQADAVFDEIVEFSGLADFIHKPIDTYSSGMYVRLGFSVAVHADPAVFLVDEVLSVGDEEFQRKCRTRIGELKEQGKTIVFVSHDLGIVNALCDRVVLLSRGSMTVRETPQATIDFYLRQIGRSNGIHRLEQDQVEAIVSHGRISVFHRQREISVPAGFQVLLESMGAIHASPYAEWEVVEREAAGCCAHGRMTKMPVTHVWDVRIDKGRLVWKIALECDRETPIENVTAQMLLPQAYSRWTYGEETGRFPEIRPSDLNPTSVMCPEVTCMEAAALPASESLLPPVVVSVDAALPYFRLMWLNSDYVTGCRILQVTARVPENDRPLPVGRHALVTVTLDLGVSEEELIRRMKAAETERTLVVGPLAARFWNGTVRLIYAGREVTAFSHVYASMLVGNLWHNSMSLHWGPVVRREGRLEATGESRRFPLCQSWALYPADEGVGLEIWLDVREAMDIEEYHTSVCLKAEYERWETEHESGAFPPFDPRRQAWRHANRRYEPSSFIRARGPGLPTVTMRTAPDAPPVRMTAINTSYDQNARVLQALRAPEAGALHLEPGRRLYFRGRLIASAGEA